MACLSRNSPFCSSSNQNRVSFDKDLIGQSNLSSEEEEMSTNSDCRCLARKRNDLDDDSKSMIDQTVEALKKYKLFFMENSRKKNELREFWHRKSQRVVLSVVCVEHPDTQELVFVRGVNTEISLVAGALCAERCAISTAFAMFPNLLRSHFKVVSVLSLNLLEILSPDDPHFQNSLHLLQLCPDFQLLKNFFIRNLKDQLIFPLINVDLEGLDSNC